MQIGFDLGGTKMLAGVLDHNNTVLARAKTKTTRGDNEAVYAQILETIDAALGDPALTDAGLGRADLSYGGIAVPGPIDDASGTVLQTPNIGMSDFPLAARLSADLGCPFFLENDVNAGLWGEYVAGAARGFDHVVGVFPGTGIGGGLILNGRLFRGKGGAAGEIGHITVQSDGRRCGCGNHGCLETVASKTAIARDLAVLAMNGTSPVLASAGATDISRIKSGLIKRALDAGDPGVGEVVRQAAEFLGIGLASMVNTFDPELIVLGGGLVEKLGTDLSGPAERIMRTRAMPRLVEGVQLRVAERGDDAAVVGAADLARRRLA